MNRVLVIFILTIAVSSLVLGQTENKKTEHNSKAKQEKPQAEN